jgi:hypothetical protein
MQPPNELRIPYREIVVTLDPSAEGPGHVYVHRGIGCELEVRHVEAQRCPFTAVLTASVEGRAIRNFSIVEARTLDELGVLLREAVLAEACADALTCMSAKRRAA